MMYLNERIDDLQRGGLRVIQRADAFRFGTDAVLLADFAAPRRHDRVCDLGTGTGIIPLLLYARENTISADAVEIQPDMADMAARSMAMNGLNEKIRVLPGDLRSIRTLLPHARYDLVTCNPPYGKAGGTLLNPDASKRLARHEESCAIEDVACAAAWLLQNGGRADDRIKRRHAEIPHGAEAYSNGAFARGEGGASVPDGGYAGRAARADH